VIDPRVREDEPVIGSRMLRQFAGLWILVFGTLAIVKAWFQHEPGTATALAILAAAVGVPGLLRPPLIRPVFVTAMAVTAPIGFVISYLLLAAIFYLLFVPIALVFRLIGRDAMTRRPDALQATYWVERTQTTDARRYLHQS